MKTNYLLFFVLALFLAACNPDDEMVECEQFIDRGTVRPSFAISQLPAGYLDLTTPLIFINDNQDSLTFNPEPQFEFGSDKVIKTACPSGDSASHVYNTLFISKRFNSAEYALSVSANITFGREIIILPSGNITSVDENCIIETLNASISKDITVGTTQLSQRFNPQNCSDDFSSLNTNHTEEASIELNGQTYTDVLVSKDTIFGQPTSSKLYFQNAKGFIAFEDDEEVLWTLQE